MLIEFELGPNGYYRDRNASPVADILNALRVQQDGMSTKAFYRWLEETLNIEVISIRNDELGDLIAAIRLEESDHTMMLLKYAEYIIGRY